MSPIIDRILKRIDYMLTLPVFGQGDTRIALEDLAEWIEDRVEWLSLDNTEESETDGNH